MIKLILTVLLCLCNSAVFGAFFDSNSASSEELDRAQTLYLSGDYVAAVSEYRKIWDSGVHAPGVLYNLANASFRAEQVGLSIAALLSAKQLRPRDTDIHSNLMFAIKQTGQDLSDDEVQALVQRDAWVFLRNLFSVREIILAVAVVWAIFFIFSTRMLFLQRSWKRTKYQLILGACGLAIGILGSQLVDTHNGAVCESSADIYTEPSETSPKIISLQEGSLVSFHDYKKSWMRILMPTGDAGFVEGRKICFFEAEFY